MVSFRVESPLAKTWQCKPIKKHQSQLIRPFFEELATHILYAIESSNLDFRHTIRYLGLLGGKVTVP